jgi:selenocysteine lyase/cysteine desulfurase
MLGAPLTAYDFVFTSNTTESINLVAENLNYETEADTEPVILNSLLEHSSNDLPWRNISRGSVVRLSVDAEGFIDFEELETKLSSYNKYNQHGKKRIKLVAISGASNVLGICNDLSVISRIAHKYGAKLLVDGAQLIAHRKVEMEGTGIDYLAFSAHKVYAPFGCGLLVVRKGLLNFIPAELEQIKLSGEENTGGIAALGKVFLLLQRIGMDVVQKEEQELTRRFLDGLSQIQGLKVYGVEDPNSPGFTRKLAVILFEIKGIISFKIAKELAAQRGIGVRFGCHCAHIIVKHLLKIGPKLERFQWLLINLFPKLDLPGLTRVSFGLENTEEDVDDLVQTLSKITKKQKTSSISRSDYQKQMKAFVNDCSLKVFSQLK